MPPYVIAGTDEAGRGPLAGPVVAAAAALTIEQRELLLSLGLNDSKKLTAKKREKIFAAMCEAGVEWRAQAASPRVIDRINILNASLWCMKRSVERLRVRPNLVLVDGNRLVPGLAVRQKAVIKGDLRVPAIAAASIAAKVLRDRVMESLDKIYPQYQFAKHKGYPSALHRALVAEYGPSPVHRLSFRGRAAMRINAKVMRALEKSVARENCGAARAAEKPRETKERPAHLAFGAAAEETAARYLAGFGYTILHRNVRVGHCEIDIIARDGDELVFAEVRARRANPVAAPEDTVGPVKLERLTRAAELWTQHANYMGFWRIDLVAVTLYDGGEMNIELIKNITEPVI